MAKKRDNVLDLSLNPAPRSTVWRHYLAWRQAAGIPVRCDNPDCRFHLEPLVWNGQSIKPILDHRSGNASDNRPENLRFLCPNCDSQNHQTRGGANVGRITKLADGSYFAKDKDGITDAVLKAKSLGEAGKFGHPTARR